MKPIRRITKLQEALKDQGIAAAMLFFSRDVFYYTGTARPSCLAVFPDDYVLFVRSGYEFALTDVFVDQKKVISQRRLESIFSEIKGRLAGKTIGTEMDMMDDGVGVMKLEDMIWVRDDGNEILTVTPRDLCEVE